MTVHSGRWSTADRAVDRWPGLPFEVPPGCAGVRVELSYDPSGGAVLDLGCEAPGGWRGWSGGARPWFAITPRWATPGYHAFPAAARGHVLLDPQNMVLSICG